MSGFYFLPAANEGDDRKFDRDDYVKGMQRSWEKMFPGMVYDGLPGEKLTGMSTNVPNAEYFEQVMLLLTYIAVSLDLPVQVLLLDPTKTNFSGWRGAVDQARQRWQVRQKNLISKFHRRVYRWKLRQWLRQHTWLQDAWLQGGLNVFGHQWNPPAWSYIEPLTDVKADELIVRGGHNSRRGVLAKRGMNYEQKLSVMRYLPVTSLMTKKQLSEYLETIQAAYADRVALQFPQEMEEAA